MSTTQAQLFAAEYAKNTAQEMLDTIKATGKKAGRVSRIVLAVSMPHQIGFILGLAPLRFGWDLRMVLESLTLILGAVLIPIAVDYLILICIQIIAARGMAKSVKRLAIGVMAFPILVSGAVNVIAPAPLVMRALFGVMVILIPMAEGLRSFIRPDFSAIEQMETEVAAQVAPAVEVEEFHARTRASITDAEKAARKRAGYDAMDRVGKVAWTKTYRARAARRTVATAPVSPGTVSFAELDANMAGATI
jgi:hypothetical protein